MDKPIKDKFSRFKGTSMFPDKEPVGKREEILNGHLKKGKDTYLAGQRHNILKAMQEYSDLKLSTLEERIEGIDVDNESFNVVTPYGKQTTVNDRKSYFKKGAEWILDQVLTEINNLKESK